jgi:hypothetical protein
MIQKLKTAVLSLACLIGFAACGQIPQVVPVATNSWDYPSKPPAYTGLPDKRPMTRVLDQTTSQKIISFTPNKAIKFTNSSLTFQPMGTPNVPFDSKIFPGMILVSAPAPTIPYGLLQKVVSVTTNPDNTMTLETTEASLAEAIAGADIKPSDVQATHFRVPVDVMLAPSDSSKMMPSSLYDLKLPKAQPQGLTYDLVNERNVCQPKNPKIDNVVSASMNSCVSLRIWVDVRIDIGWWLFVPYLNGFGATMNGFQSWSLSSNITLGPSVSKQWPFPGDGDSLQLINYNPTPITFFIGPIPIVITPNLSLSINTQGEIRVNASLNSVFESSLLKFGIGLGSENSPLQYGFFCNWSNCVGINNLEQKFDQFRQSLQNWQPTAQPLFNNLAYSTGLKIFYRGNVNIDAGLFLYGFLGFTAGINPYIEPSLDVTGTYISSSQVPAFVETKLMGAVTAGVNGTIKVNLKLVLGNFKLENEAILVRGALVNPINLVPPFGYCWRNGQQYSC